MLLQRLDDGFDDIAVGPVAAFHMDVGLGVEVPALSLQLLQCRLAIDVTKEGTSVQPGGAAR